MHDTALEMGATFFSTYLKNTADLTIVDIGSLDVNGSLRSVAPKNNKYLGLDFEPGKGVDITITDPYSLPFESESVDVAVTSSCFEHSEFFWLLFNQALRILKPEGLLYINAPSNGWYHRYPVDCWRFYPDSGVALQNWGKRSGYNCALLESFVGLRKDDLWNDFTAVFVKDEDHRLKYPDRIQDTTKVFENGRLYGSEQIINYNLRTEDQELLQAEKVARLAERDCISAERDAAVGEKNKIAAERDAIEADRAIIAAERDAVTRERDAAIRDNDVVTRERDAVTRERDAVTRERGTAIRERDVVTRQRDAVIYERDAILRSRAWRMTAPLRYLRGLQMRLFEFLGL